MYGPESYTEAEQSRAEADSEWTCKILADAEISIRLEGADALQGILDSGQSGGDSDTLACNQRVSTELNKLGVPVDSYGDVAVTLKPSVKVRTSFTLGDSFASTYETASASGSYDYNVASGLTDVNISVLPSKPTFS